MRNMFMKTVTGFMAVGMTASVALADPVKVKTRLDHFAGTNYVLVISTVPSEITSITCEKWTMLGQNSWKGQNNFTIPAASKGGVSVAVMDANKFDGYCSAPGSIKAHTDDGDVIGHLDAGDGAWKASTKLTFTATAD